MVTLERRDGNFPFAQLGDRFVYYTQFPQETPVSVDILG